MPPFHRPAASCTLCVMRVPRTPHDEVAIIRTVRDSRFASSVACPRCACDHVVRWGGFSGRQRYRCRGCGRTFSDLTSTLFAYSKRLSHWPHYLAQVRHATPLRQAAAETGVHLTTAFRWRHALLDAVRVREPIRMEGRIEYAELSFSYSEKGSRDVAEPRPRGMRGRGWEWYQTPRADAALLYGRTGVVFGCALAASWRATIDSVFQSRLAPGCTILSPDLRLGRVATAARRGGHRHETVRRHARGADGLLHLDNVSAYAHRLRRWINRFRGVATRYLDNYLAWHRAVDPDLSTAWVMALVCGVSRAPPGMAPP